jgi:general secretion pathway protein D
MSIGTFDQALRTSLLFGAVMLSGCAAQRAYEDGRQLAKDGQYANAAERFAQARRLDPDSARYRLAEHLALDATTQEVRDKTREALAQGKSDEAKDVLASSVKQPRGAREAADRLHALQVQERHQGWLSQAKAAVATKEWDKARGLLRRILVEEPAHPQAIAMSQSLDDAEIESKGSGHQALSQAYRKPISIEFKDTPLKTVFEVISRTSGINFLFDKEIKLDQKTSIYLRNSTIEAAVRLTLMTNQLEQYVLDANSVMIYPATQAKLREYQPLKVRVFYLANAEAKTVANTLKTILKTKDLVSDDKLNMLIMRDTPDAIALAEKLITAHDVTEAEVMLEVEVLEVNRKRLLELGVRWPEQLGLTPLGANPTGLTLADLWNRSRQTTGVTIGPTNINARKVDSDGEVLANPRIRVRNRQKAKILIGDRVPNITSTSSATGFVAESINYVDVGLKLDVEPIISVDDEVSMNISLEVSNIVDQIKTQAGSIAYRIGTRSAQTVLRLKDGENQVLAGLLSNDERSSSNKVPGLGELPIAGRLFGSQLDEENKTEIILSITPRIVRNIRRPGGSVLEYDSGTEASLAQTMVARSTVTTTATPQTNATTNTRSADAKPNTPERNNASIGFTTRWIGPNVVRQGDMVAFQLLVDSPQPIVSVPLAVSFDPKAFQVAGVAEGDFLKRGGAKSNFAHRVDASGQILLTGTLPGEAVAQGSGVLATFSLRALSGAPAQTNLRITGLAPVGQKGAAVTAIPSEPFSIAVEP